MALAVTKVCVVSAAVTVLQKSRSLKRTEMIRELNVSDSELHWQAESEHLPLAVAEPGPWLSPRMQLADSELAAACVEPAAALMAVVLLVRVVAAVQPEVQVTAELVLLIPRSANLRVWMRLRLRLSLRLSLTPRRRAVMVTVTVPLAVVATVTPLALRLGVGLGDTRPTRTRRGLL